MRQEVENLTDKPLSEFRPGEDTIYVRQMRSDHDYMLFGTFEGMDRGLVYVLVTKVDPHWGEPDFLGKCVKVKKTSCYLWGKSGDHGRRPGAHCHWFGNDGRLE